MKLGVLTPSGEAPLSWRAPFDLLARALRPLGVEAQAVPWRDFDGEGFDAATPLFAWGYHEAPERWFELLGRAGLRFVNPAEALRWNAHKSYLLGLGRHARTVPTQLVERLSADRLEAAFAAFGDELVIKPATGASASGVRRLRRGEEAPELEDVLVQPFEPSIRDEGEVSLMLFAGAFSHAVRKVPRAGEYRVQSELGGSVEAFAPDGAALELAGRALAAAPAPLAYARVDLVRDRDGRWAVMELEAIEPELFLDREPQAPVRLARAIAESLGEGTR